MESTKLPRKGGSVANTLLRRLAAGARGGGSDGGRMNKGVYGWIGVEKLRLKN